jgi:DNA-binding transcriptional LysR family regulator
MRGQDFAEMGAFVAIAERRSFAKAAAYLGVSPSTLSEQLRKLEERLGLRLLERTTRSVAPTAAGERLLQRLRPVIEDYQAALESINDFRDKPAGALRLTVAPPAAEFVLGPVIARFLAHYPQIELEIAVDGGLTDIVAGRFDAGIRRGERLERDMIAVRVSGELRTVIVAAPDYLARHQCPQTPQDLQAHECIRLRLPSGAVLPWRLASDGQTLDVAVAGSLTVNDMALGMRAALDGVGLLQTLADYVAPIAGDGRLVPVLEDWAPAPESGFFLYYPGRRHVRAPLRALIDFLRESGRSAASDRAAFAGDGRKTA